MYTSNLGVEISRGRTCTGCYAARDWRSRGARGCLSKVENPISRVSDTSHRSHNTQNEEQNASVSLKPGAIEWMTAQIRNNQFLIPLLSPCFRTSTAAACTRTRRTTRCPDTCSSCPASRGATCASSSALPSPPASSGHCLCFFLYHKYVCVCVCGF